MLQRREFATLGTAVAAALAFQATAFGQQPKTPAPKAAVPKGAVPKADPTKPAAVKKPDDAAHAGHEMHDAMSKCAEACNACQMECDMCAHHCAGMLAEGKKDHLETLRTCVDCATVCSAAARIVAMDGPFSDVICKACAEACGRCAKACEGFPDDEHMKRCAEQCRKCEKACQEMMNHGEH